MDRRTWGPPPNLKPGLGMSPLDPKCPESGTRLQGLDAGVGGGWARSALSTVQPGPQSLHRHMKGQERLIAGPEACGMPGAVLWDGNPAPQNL